MIENIYMVTDGDYVVIQLSSGKRYRFNGFQQAALRTGSLNWPLQGANAIGDLVDRETQVTGSTYPVIDRVVPGSNDTTYHLEASDGDEFELTADEMKTVLGA